MIKFLKKNKGIAAGLFILTIIVCLAVFADFLTPYAFDTITLSDKLQPPSAAHIMGTDNFGRDIWTRVIYGARISLTVSLAAVALGLVLGCLLGLMGGYFKGPFDFALGRVMDIFMSFPSILLSLLIGIALGPSILNMCLSLGIPLIPAFYRVTRGAALNVGERTYVMAARSMGTKSSKILFRHILPNTLPQIFVILSFSVGLHHGGIFPGLSGLRYSKADTVLGACNQRGQELYIQRPVDCRFFRPDDCAYNLCIQPFGRRYQRLPGSEIKIMAVTL